MSYSIMDMEIIGSRINLSRHQAGMSLRDLSVKTGFSYSYLNRIEQGLVRPKDDSIERILNAVNIRMRHDVAKNKAFETIYEKLWSLLMYGEYEKAKDQYRKLVAERNYYTRSVVFRRFYLITLTTVLNTRIDFETLDEIYKTVLVLEPYMSKAEKDLMVINKAIYMLLRSQHDAAWDYLNSVLPNLSDNHLRGRGYYLLGVIITNDYRYYYEALDYFDKARTIFDEYMNFDRANRAKAMSQTIYIHLQRYDDFERFAKETAEFALAYGATNLYFLVSVNRARYYIMVEDYEEALRVLDKFTMNEGPYYFFKSLSHFRLKNNIEALRLAQNFKKQTRMFVTDLETMAFDIFNHALTKGSDDSYLRKLKAFCDSAHAQRDFVMIQVGTVLYTEILEEKRMYKEAYLYAEKYLDVLYKINHISGGIL